VQRGVPSPPRRPLPRDPAEQSRGASLHIALLVTRRYAAARYAYVSSSSRLVSPHPPPATFSSFLFPPTPTPRPLPFFPPRFYVIVFYVIVFRDVRVRDPRRKRARILPRARGRGMRGAREMYT